MNKAGRVVLFMAACLLFFGVVAGCSHEPDKEPPHSEDAKNGGDILTVSLRESWNGDLDAILRNRRVIRVLVAYSKTNFAVVQGRPQGLEYELFRDYEKFLEPKAGRRKIKPVVVFTAVPRDQLIPMLIGGRGDIAAGLTVTPERGKHVAFTDPYIKDVAEVVVTGKDVSGLNALDDLSGRTVDVVAGSGDAELLGGLSRRLVKEGRRPIRIVEADKILEAEDVLEMVNSGIFRITVVEEYIADLWKHLLPDIVVRKDIVLDKGAEIAWAVRKGNPRLLGSLNEFINAKTRRSTMLGDILLSKYYGSTKWVRNPLTYPERRKLVKFQSYFEKYARIYGFDWLKIAAMAYRESRLDRNVRSRAGAIGIMQILPEAASEVGIRDILTVGNNIHAGVKYLAYLRDTYFDDPDITPAERVDFALAAYNAGPSRMEELRRKAAEMGLNPNRWFFNVERVALREVGWETVQYVADIYKYYFAYKSAERIVREKRIQKKRIRRRENG